MPLAMREGMQTRGQEPMLAADEHVRPTSFQRVGCQMVDEESETRRSTREERMNHPFLGGGL